MASKSLNRSLSAAQAAKQDEFYTQYIDIEKEVEAYLELDPDTFHNKIVYCNCDDPSESLLQVLRRQLQQARPQAAHLHQLRRLAHRRDGSR